MKRAQPAAAALALCCAAAAAEPHQVVDLRKRTDAAGSYEISFCARPSPGRTGLPGHAFVAFSHVEPGKPRVFRAVGHTTSASAAKTVLTYGGAIGVPGRLAEERYTAVRENCLVAKVNDSDYRRALGRTQPVFRRWGIGSADDPVLATYSLGDKDCMDFMLQVAQDLRAPALKLPRRGAAEFPLPYLRRLIDANRP